MKSIEELKAEVRMIRAGQAREGVSLEGDILTSDGKRYKVQGLERLKITEVTFSVIKEPKEVKVPTLTEACLECGVTFSKSKFHPYTKKCPSCRKGRREEKPSRHLTCTECLTDFTVSKFQPYLNSNKCPRCQRKERQAKYRKKLKEGIPPCIY